MVVLKRTDLGRNRIIYVLTIILSIAAIVSAVSLYSQSAETVQAVLIVLAVVGLFAMALSVIQLYGFPQRSHALLIQHGEEMVIATNALHEGFKLRFLRDVLVENVYSFSDAERARWKFLEQDGYYPSLCVKKPKKLLILRLCTLMFDDVFAVDASNRWEHHDSGNTSEPTFARGEKPRLTAWKQI